MTDHIKIERADGVITLTITRPEKKNAITQAMYGAMADAITAYGEDDGARAFVMTGTGDMFTAGNDLGDFSTGDRSGPDVPPVTRFLGAIKDCPKPLIAAVNGGAIGVGLTMLLHCDLVYAGQSATFSAPFVGLGLVPEAASSMLLPAAVGMAVANDVFLTGRKLTAAEAHDYGLVARVFDDGELGQAVAAIAQGVAGASPSAVKHSKALIRYQREEVTTRMQAEGELFLGQLRSPDFAESVSAKMAGRKPVYK